MQERVIFNKRFLCIFFLVSLGFIFSGCKSISSSTYGEGNNITSWVVFDTNEFNKAQRTGQYPESVAGYFEDGNSYIYLMSLLSTNKTFNQAKEFCSKMNNTKRGGNIRLPTEDDVSRYKPYFLLARHKFDNPMRGKIGAGDEYVNYIWIDKKKIEDDLYDSYVLNDFIIKNVPSNRRDPIVVCVSDEHLNNVVKIPWQKWEEEVLSRQVNEEQKRELRIKEYCEKNQNDKCCVRYIRGTGIDYELQLNELDEVIGLECKAYQSL